jgi:Transcription factor Pcc1
MQIKARIKFEYQTEKQAKIALKSLHPDNTRSIKSHIMGNKLIYDINGDSLNTFLATVDDLLFCEMIVEKVLEFEK